MKLNFSIQPSYRMRLSFGSKQILLSLVTSFQDIDTDVTRLVVYSIITYFLFYVKNLY